MRRVICGCFLLLLFFFGGGAVAGFFSVDGTQRANQAVSCWFSCSATKPKAVPTPNERQDAGVFLGSLSNHPSSTKTKQGHLQTKSKKRVAGVP